MKFQFSVTDGDPPEVVACERLGAIAWQLDRIADAMEAED